MRRNVILRTLPFFLILLLLCSFCAFASAEGDLPAYTGKLTVEDTFNEEANWFLEGIPKHTFYTYNPERPEWKILKNWSWIYRIGLTSGEPIKNCTIEQLSGPTELKAFSYRKKESLIDMKMDKMSQAAPGTYHFLVTAEGETRYARAAFSCEIQNQPAYLAPLQVRPLLILNTMDTVQNPLESVLISAPEEARSSFEIYNPKIRWYSSTHSEDEVDSSKDGCNFILDWTEDGQYFTPLSEGVYKAEVSAWLGQVLAQDINFDVIVSSSLSYDDFALTLTPEATEAAAGQKIKIEAAFADPAEVNAKAKNDGINWSIKTADGGDASEFATIAKGVVTIKKLTAAQDLVVTAEPKLVPEKGASVTIHAVPTTGTLTATADTETLYLAEGADEAQISVTAEPADAVPAITYKSSSEKIATVDGNGHVKAVSAGNATLTVTAGDGSKKKATVKLLVIAPVTGLTLTAAQESAAPGKTIKIKAALEPEKPTDKTLTFTITAADEGMAEYLKIGKDGSVSIAKGCPAGSFTLQASANGAAPNAPVTAEIKLSVTE